MSSVRVGFLAWGQSVTSQLQQPDLLYIETAVREFRQRLFQSHLPQVKVVAAVGARPASTTRVSAAELSNADRLIPAYNQLINTGFVSECMSIHVDMSHMMHDSMGPWVRSSRPTLSGTDAVLDSWSDTGPKACGLANYHYYDALL